MGEVNQPQEYSIGNGKTIELISCSSAINDLKANLNLIARSQASVLITGENGTGKEVVANIIHCMSPRSKRKMVSINCGAIPSDLVESELFGHAKGAFTGAVSEKVGCFEEADGSTLFLDEIGEMPLSSQVKLLRAVELGSFRKVGGKKEQQVDIRIIAATNKILIDLVKSGDFREDLFYRLNVIELNIPPLRHRKEDIELLSEHFRNIFAIKYNRDGITISEEVFDIFDSYHWPGNVRELRNIIERCIILCEEGTITKNHLPPRLFETNRMPYYLDKDYINIPKGFSLENAEQKIIRETLIMVDNNKSEAAKILGFTRKTLHSKLKKYDFE